MSYTPLSIHADADFAINGTKYKLGSVPLWTLGLGGVLAHGVGGRLLGRYLNVELIRPARTPAQAGWTAAITGLALGAMALTLKRVN